MSSDKKIKFWYSNNILMLQIELSKSKTQFLGHNFTTLSLRAKKSQNTSF